MYAILKQKLKSFPKFNFIEGQVGICLVFYFLTFFNKINEEGGNWCTKK